MQNSLLKLKKKSPRLPFRKDNNSLRQERLSQPRSGLYSSCRNDSFYLERFVEVAWFIFGVYGKGCCFNPLLFTFDLRIGFSLVALTLKQIDTLLYKSKFMQLSIDVVVIVFVLSILSFLHISLACA